VQTSDTAKQNATTDFNAISLIVLKPPAGVMSRPWGVPDEVLTSQVASVYISNCISLIFVFSLRSCLLSSKKTTYRQQ
jgi:hypothetical protein